MDRLRRICRLHQILKAHRHPVTLGALQERMECSRASVKRIIREMRLFFDAPIAYDRQGNGYYYARSGDCPFELPGLWFSGRELHALMSAQHLFAAGFGIRFTPPRELVMDILKNGPDVKVLGPDGLRRHVAARLRAAAARYPD